MRFPPAASRQPMPKGLLSTVVSVTLLGLLAVLPLCMRAVGAKAKSDTTSTATS